MTRQEYAIFFETVSFFMVALDLYGPDRLQKTQSNLMLVSEKIQAKVNYFRNEYWEEDKKKKFVKWFFIIGLVGSGSLSGLFMVLEGEFKLWVFIIITLVTFPIVLLLIFLLTALTVFLTWLVNAMCTYLLKLLLKIRFEGLLLFLGTILFLYSQYLQLD